MSPEQLSKGEIISPAENKLSSTQAKNHKPTYMLQSSDCEIIVNVSLINGNIWILNSSEMANMMQNTTITYITRSCQQFKKDTVKGVINHS